MRRGSRIALWLLLGASALLLGVQFSTARLRWANEQKLAALQREQAGLSAARQAAQARLAQAQPAVPAAPPRPTAPAAPAKPAEPPARSMYEVIAHHPRLQLLELERQRAATNQTYTRLYQQLKLSPQEIEAIRRIEQQRAEAWLDLSSIEKTQGAETKPATDTLKAKVMSDRAAALAELFGPERFRQIQEFEASIGVFNVVVYGLAGVAALEGAPLTPEQGQRLLAATVAAGAPAVLGDTAGVDRKSIDWPALDAAAQTILTPAQFALFKNVEVPSGFQGRSRYELDAAIDRALAAERSAKPSP